MRLLLVMSTLCAIASAAMLRAESPAEPTPVVLELYTSQGCSACPPADALFADLAQEEGVIALALHVDYWDYLGWSDPFGSAAFSDRQRGYAKAARSRTIFTPEMIVQGEGRLKGHDADGIRAQIEARRQVPSPVRVSLLRKGDDVTIGLAAVASGVGPADVQVVRYLPSQVVDIEGGENAGERVTYANVVTAWDTIARWDGAAPIELQYDAETEGPLAVIVQKAGPGPILGAAALR